MNHTAFTYLVVFFMGVILAWTSSPAQSPLTTLEYQVTGQQLQVTPAALAVPKGIPGSFLASVRTGGGESDAAGTFVEATLRGPSFPARRIVGAPNEPILLPPLSLVGDYSLDNIRLVDSASGEVLIEGTPASIPITVFDEVLVARVTSRPLSSSEIRERGIVIDESNFRAVEFEVGFVVDGQTVPVRFPVVTPAFRQQTEAIPRAELEAALAEADRINNELSLGAQLPPALETSNLNIEVKPINIQFVDPGGEKDLELSIPPLAGLVVVPGKIGFLNQFFSVQVFVENAAPSGSGLSVTDIEAELVLPPGPDLERAERHDNPGDDPLRFARIGAGAEVFPVLPITQLGPDGVSGTTDDVLRLQPGDLGQAEFLVEGLREGLHVFDVELRGKLEGLVAGAVEVEGLAAGSVFVRNPSFSLAFSHPRTIRAQEPYRASVTILNTSGVIANQVSVTLPASAVSGARLESEETVLVGDIAPGETATASFDLRSLKTGSITFSNFISDENVVGRFRLRTGVDERGVVLSPDSIGYPDYVNDLPDVLLAAAERVLGQALSIATAPQLPAGVKPVARRFIETRVLELAEAGQRVRYGDPLPRVLADLLLDWQGARKFGAGFHQIIRETDAGAEWRATIADLLDSELPGAPSAQLASRASDLAGRGEQWWFGAADEPGLKAQYDPTWFEADYPGAGGSLLVAPAGNAERALAWSAPATASDVEFSLLKLDGLGAGETFNWSGIDVPAGGTVRVLPGTTPPRLEVDGDNDGTPDLSIAGTSDGAVTESAPEVIAAVQDLRVLVGRPRPGVRCIPPGDIDNYGTIVAVLFSKPMDAEGVESAASYLLDDGNHAVSVRIQPGGRVALVKSPRGDQHLCRAGTERGGRDRSAGQ